MGGGSKHRSRGASSENFSLYMYVAAATVRRACSVCRALVGPMILSARSCTLSSLLRCVGAAPSHTSGLYLCPMLTTHLFVMLQRYVPQQKVKSDVVPVQ